MRPRWVTTVLCIGVLAAAVQAFPTQDEYIVVAGSDPTSTVPSVDQHTTNKPNAPIKMTQMRVRSDIALRYARTAVITNVQNPAQKAQEVTFRMLLPETAFISGFTMFLSGKSYKAYVKEKEEAKQIYTQAVAQGIGAAHIATKARDSNHFTVTVNVEPNTTAIFDLRYEEFLVRRNGLYNHAINLHPGAVVPKMEVVVHIKESQKITKLFVPEVRTGNEIDATEKDAQNSKAVIKKDKNEQEVTVTFTPDPAEQKRLAEIYADKTKQKSSLEKYIGYSSTEDEEDEGEDGTVLGQFIVQYDVDRTKSDEILVNDGYFVHFLAPTSLPPLSKYVVFVLDTSGSMMGRKIEQLRNAMEAILSDLNPNDYFSIVEFNSDVKVHELKEADEEPPPRHTFYSYFNSRNTPVTLVPPSYASLENIAKAKVIVSRLIASGGTNIYSALDVALDLVIKGVHQENETKAKKEIADSKDVVADTDKDIGNKKGKELEPIIIFLTDGDPTVGETNIARITSFVSEKNTGDNRASLYSLAFGEDADRSFLRRLSLRNEGFMRHIYEAADAALQLHDFYRQVSSPLLSHVQFLYPNKQIKEGTVSRNKFRTVNAGSEVAVVGQIADDVTEVTPQILAFCGNDDGLGRKRYELTPKVAVNLNKDEYLPLERLWAYLTIKQLLDQKDAGTDNSDDATSPGKKALAIALKYSFVTPLTSLVVVKPNETNSVDVESVDKQVANEGVSYHLLSAPARPLGGVSHLLAGGAGGIAGPPSYAFAAVQPLALDAAHFPEALVDDELDYPIGYTRDRFQTDRRGGLLSRNKLRIDTFAPEGFDFSSYESTVYQSSEGSTTTTTTTPLNPYGGFFSFERFHKKGVFQVDSYPSTPATQPHRAEYATTGKPPSYRDYHLEGFDWTSSILDTSTDALKMDVNGTQVILKLTKDTNAPKEDGGDSACQNSISQSAEAVPSTDDTKENVCVYLTRCSSARTITVEDYKKSYCLVNNRYAGICCSKKEVDK